VTDLLGGQIQMMMVTPLLVEPHARAGKLRLLAAATRERIARLPELPTVSESGAPGYEAGTWFAIMGPAGMPREVTNSIYANIKLVLNEPAFRDRYVDKQWFEIVANTPDEFAALLKTEYERWEKIVKLSGVTVDQ
jgi:tripartite-type tricarboxylate transporter receptor subunit TctC